VNIMPHRRLVRWPDEEREKTVECAAEGTFCQCCRTF
jgi:hypothetical protein